MVDIIESIERDERAMERIASALEVLASNSTEYVKLCRERMNKEFPSKREPRDAIVTQRKSDEDRLREEQGQTGEATAREWTETPDEWIGQRERTVISRKGSQ